MNKSDLLKNLEKLNMRPGRGLGQNFLLDNNLLEFIARSANITPGEVVLEVGPGFGALTEKMVSAGYQVTAIEFDHRLADYLRKKFDGAENFRLIEADACKVNYDELFPQETTFRAIANLPYAISSVFIARILESSNLPVSMFFMLQKEMGERLAASPGSKAYGALSVRTQLYYDVTIDKIVPPQVFCPPPEVDSALVAFRLRDITRLSPQIEEIFTGVVRALFNQRRKQMGKVLGSYLGSKEKSLQILEECGFSAELRPDKLTVDDFIRLSSTICGKQC